MSEQTAKPSSPPPWERGFLLRLHRWGLQNPKYYYIMPPSVLAIFIYVTSLTNLRPLEEEKWSRGLFAWIEAIPGHDKLVHFTYYALLALLIIRGWQREKMPPLGLHCFVWLICATFGIMIEVQQGLTGYRSFEWLDELANTLGALTGQIIWHLMMVRWGKRTRLYPGLLRPATPPPRERRGTVPKD